MLFSQTVSALALSFDSVSSYLQELNLLTIFLRLFLATA